MNEEEEDDDNNDVDDDENDDDEDEEDEEKWIGESGGEKGRPVMRIGDCGGVLALIPTTLEVFFFFKQRWFSHDSSECCSSHLNKNTSWDTVNSEKKTGE